MVGQACSWVAVCAQQHIILNVCHELLNQSHIPANKLGGELLCMVDVGSWLTKEAGRSTVGIPHQCCACKYWNSDLVNFLTSIMNLSRRSLSIPNHSRRIVLRKTVKYRKATCRAYGCIKKLTQQQLQQEQLGMLHAVSPLGSETVRCRQA